MTLNGVMAVTLRYFTEFGKPAFQHITIGATTVGTGGYWSLNFLAVVFKKKPEISRPREPTNKHSSHQNVEFSI